jgi:hypothetical protein
VSVPTIELVTTNRQAKGTMQTTMKVCERTESTTETLVVHLRPASGGSGSWINWLHLRVTENPEIVDWKLGDVFEITIERRAADHFDLNQVAAEIATKAVS